MIAGVGIAQGNAHAISIELLVKLFLAFPAPIPASFNEFPDFMLLIFQGYGFTQLIKNFPLLLLVYTFQFIKWLPVNHKIDCLFGLILVQEIFLNL